MSFFFKSDSDDNLQYDDTAFMHFSISFGVVTAFVFLVFIVKEYYDNQLKGLTSIRSLPIFKKKIDNTNKKKKSYFSTWSFGWKLIVVILAMLSIAYSYSQVEGDSKMIGFDPHEILGVDIDAPVNAIKKAYRKLALEYHPDRNQNNPQAAAKFIQISKAYECLTDQEAKQKCAKYGNPDGETSFKVGIGLPGFMMKQGNQYILIPIFILLLVIIPKSFINWSSRIRPQDGAGNLIANYPVMHQFFSPRFSIMNAPIMMGCMKQLDTIFTEKKVLAEQKQKWFKEMTIRTGILTEKQLQNIEPHILYRCFQIYSYMAGKQIDERISEVFPELAHKMTLFSCFFAQRMNDGQYLGGNPNMPITWCGMEPTKNILFFTLQMFNPSLRLGAVQSIEFLDLTQNELEIAKTNPIEDIHKQLHEEVDIDKFVTIFPEDNRNYIKQQIKQLPCFNMTCRVLLGKQQTTQMTIDDFATLQIKLKRARSTSGYLIIKDYPYLIKETFYLALSYNANLMFFAPFTNDDFKNDEMVFNIQHRQTVERDMKFQVDIMFPYPKMNLKGQISVNVTAPKPNSKVYIHPEDLEVEKAPKNFFESLASLETYNESDRELSDGEDSDEQAEPKKKNNKFVEEDENTGKSCDCDHEHQH